MGSLPGRARVRGPHTETSPSAARGEAGHTPRSGVAEPGCQTQLAVASNAHPGAQLPEHSRLDLRTREMSGSVDFSYPLGGPLHGKAKALTGDLQIGGGYAFWAPGRATRRANRVA